MNTLANAALIPLLIAAKQADRGAFVQIYEHYRNALLRFFYAHCSSADLAEELSSELWLRVVEHLPHFNLPLEHADLAFTGWLFQIARHLLTDGYRQRQRQAYEPLNEATALANSDPTAISELHAIQASLVHALAALTPDQREVVYLRFFAHYTSAQVAAYTGRTEYAVKSLQYRALHTLARSAELRQWYLGEKEPLFKFGV